MALQILHEGGDVEGLYVGEPVQAVQLAPLGKAARRIQVGFPGVVVVNLRGEDERLEYWQLPNSHAGA